jgi:hypothetical protein|tara:strand:- start:585 stop:1259 length:675 start_codon:yes stop_codon:yes gene_type:complete
MDLIEASRTAQRCQRNWDYSRPVTKEDIETLTKVATTMPTKQNIDYFELLVSTNAKFNQMCYDIAVNPDDPFFAEGDNKLRNAQVNAPLLMIWVPNYNNPLMDDRAVNTKDDDGNLTGDYEECNRDIATGISSGATALAAAQLGYKTGFCACMDWPKLKDLIKKDFTDPEVLRIVDKLGDKNNGLCLGIGHPNSNFERTEVVKDNKKVLNISSFDKEIKTTILQ